MRGFRARHFMTGEFVAFEATDCGFDHEGNARSVYCLNGETFEVVTPGDEIISRGINARFDRDEAAFRERWIDLETVELC